VEGGQGEALPEVKDGSVGSRNEKRRAFVQPWKRRRGEDSPEKPKDVSKGNRTVGSGEKNLLLILVATAKSELLLSAGRGKKGR